MAVAGNADSLKRADQLLVDSKLARSRTQARRWLEQGCVEVFLDQQWQLVKKPGMRLPLDCQFRITPQAEDRFVSRGGLKLDGALAQAGLDVSGQVWLDIGQSTGGFTDCLLQRGARHVVGVDVGKDQLVSELREHLAVDCFENINARQLPSAAELGYPDFFDGICMDMSFISQALVVPGLAALLKPGAAVVALVKPQFELQPGLIGKGGIVRNSALYQQVEDKIRESYESNHFEVLDYSPSCIKGGDGNREFFIVARKSAT